MIKMRKKIGRLFLIIIALQLLMTSGCWNRRELNELAILSGLGVDPGPKADEITLVYQVINASAISGKGVSSMKTPFITLKTSGKTLFSAVRKGTRECSRRLYFGHVQVYIISSEVAEKKGITDLLDLIYRDHEIRENIKVLIAKNQKAEAVLSTQSILENNSGMSLLKHLENACANEGTAKLVELRDVISSQMNPTSDLVIPTVYLSPSMPKSKLDYVQDSTQESVLKTSGFAVFKKDKLIGYLNPEEARALNWIRDDLERTVIVVPYKGADNSIEVIHSKTEIKTEFKNGKPEVLLDIQIDANIGEVNAAVDLTKLSTIQDFKTQTNLVVKSDIENLIKRVQKDYKVDIFQFSDVLERQHPKEWKKIKDNWEEYLINLKVEIKVNTTIKEVGMENNTFQIKMKEK